MQPTCSPNTGFLQARLEEQAGSSLALASLAHGAAPAEQLAISLPLDPVPSRRLSPAQQVAGGQLLSLLCDVPLALGREEHSSSTSSHSLGQMFNCLLCNSS